MALLFFCQAGLCVLLLAALVPPFQNSDEFNHVKRADQIAAGHLVATRFGGADTSGGVADLGIDRVDAVIGPIRFHSDRKVSDAMLRQAGAIGWGQRAPMTFANTAIYAPFLYLPASFGLAAGRDLGFSVSRTLIVARAVSGLASVGLASVAIGLAGEAAPLLLVLLSLPMSLSLFGAVSQDGPMLAAAALSVALLLRGRGFYVSCAALALVILGRPAYAPLAVMALLLPGLGRRQRFVACACVLAPTALWAAVTARFTMINTEAHRGVHPSAQLVTLMTHPGRIWSLAVRAVTDRQGMEGLPFYKECVGVLGWLDVVLPAWFYETSLLALLLGIFASLPHGEPALGEPALGKPALGKPALGAGGRLVLAGALVASIGAVFLLQYMTFTPVGLGWVQGVQGRYFLPVALFVPAMLPGLRRRGVARAAMPGRILLLVYPGVSVVVTVVSVVRRYYV
jgi:hypothetical protein